MFWGSQTRGECNILCEVALGYAVPYSLLVLCQNLTPNAHDVINFVLVVASILDYIINRVFGWETVFGFRCW